MPVSTYDIPSKYKIIPEYQKLYDGSDNDDVDKVIEASRSVRFPKNKVSCFFKSCLDKINSSTEGISYECAFPKDVFPVLHENLKSLELVYDAPLELLRNLPKGLLYLNLRGIAPEKMKEVIFPPNLQGLILPRDFNEDLNEIKLPDSLSELTISGIFNKEIEKLPPKLKILKFYGDFNNKIKEYPQSLLKLRFSDRFNQKIDNLPENLLFLLLGRDFNQEINNLPSNLRKLKIGGVFDKEIKNLPSDLYKIYESIEQQNHISYPLNPKQVIIKNVPSWY